MKIRSFFPKECIFVAGKSSVRMYGLLRNMLWVWLFMLLGGTNLTLARNDGDRPFRGSFVERDVLSASDQELSLPGSDDCLILPLCRGALPAETSVSHSDHKTSPDIRPLPRHFHEDCVAPMPELRAADRTGRFRPVDYYVYSLRRILI